MGWPQAAPACLSGRCGKTRRHPASILNASPRVQARRPGVGQGAHCQHPQHVEQACECRRADHPLSAGQGMAPRVCMTVRRSGGCSQRGRPIHCKLPEPSGRPLSWRIRQPTRPQAASVAKRTGGMPWLLQMAGRRCLYRVGQGHFLRQNDLGGLLVSSLHTAVTTPRTAATIRAGAASYCRCRT